MKDLSRRQLLQVFFLSALSPLAGAVPIGSLLGNKNAAYTQFLLSRYLTWYQKEFFPFQEHLHTDEINLLKMAIRSLPSWNEFLNPNHAIDRFFVGHELNAGKVTSGRLSTFTDIRQPAVKRAVEQVLKRHGAKQVLQSSGGELYGVGWDCDQNIFKIYIRYLQPNAFKNLKLKELRLYRVQKNVSATTKSSTIFGPHITQVTEVLSDQGPLAPHWRLNYFPGISIPAALERVAEKQAQNYRFALDSLRYTGPERIVVYYP